jgi:hypothetical protein
MGAFIRARQNWLLSLLSWLCDGYWPEPSDDGVSRVQGRRRIYTLDQVLAEGDAANIYVGTARGNSGSWAEERYIVKVSRVPGGHARLRIEQEALTRLLSAAGDSTYRKYLPDMVESFSASDVFPRRVNVFLHQPGFHTLEQVHEQHPALDGRHLAWIFKRLLAVLGFSHRQNTLHGAVLPCHVMIDAAGHGLQLVGWGQSVQRGRRIKNVPTRFKNWYPPEVQRKRPADTATDLFLAARCMVYVAGGDPMTNWMPDSVPLPMRRFFTTCLLESVRMRPADAWALHEEFDELLRRLYGSPRFHELIIT